MADADGRKKASKKPASSKSNKGNGSGKGKASKGNKGPKGKSPKSPKGRSPKSKSPKSTSPKGKSHTDKGKGKSQCGRGGRGRGAGRGRGVGRVSKASEKEPLETPSPKPKKNAEGTPSKTSPKASAKAKAKRMSDKLPRAKATRTKHSDEDKSFARRAKPSRPDTLNQWLAIRDAFNSSISESMACPSSHQDTFVHASIFWLQVIIAYIPYRKLASLAGALLAAGEAFAGRGGRQELRGLQIDRAEVSQ